MDEKKKFDMDWELATRLDELAVSFLKNGCSPSETQIKIINSELYKEWTSVQRSFIVHFHDTSRYEDLFANSEFEDYANKLYRIALHTIQGKPTSDAVMSFSAYIGPIVYDIRSRTPQDRLFLQIGMTISPYELGVHIGEFSKLMNFSEPLTLLAFLALFTNNASGLFSVEMDKLQYLAENELQLEAYKRDFVLRYSRNGVVACTTRTTSAPLFFDRA